MSLTPRERVLTILNHETPDRVPIFLGASNATGISMPAYRNLKQLLSIKSQDRFLYEWLDLGTAVMDVSILDRLHSDVRGVLDHEPAYVRE
jgi:uroporphyrinogen decarboxylase